MFAISAVCHTQKASVKSLSFRAPAAAGGRFRGRIGRQLFQTTQLCQSVLEPNLVTNKLGFRLLGVLSGHVGLRGQFESVGDAADTVKVLPPQSWACDVCV